MKKQVHGTLFAVPLPDGTFLPGRVMLDIRACLRKRLFPPDSPLPGLGSAYLVEMYRAITPTPEFVRSEILIPGAFVEHHEIGGAWPIIGHRPFTPEEVEFPETLIGHNHPKGAVAFECGEIRVLLPLSYEDVQKISVYKTRHSAFLWPFTCLRMLGRQSEVPADYKMATLEGTDLRFSDGRDRVYELLSFPPNSSYYERQKLLGLNLDRLYDLVS